MPIQFSAVAATTVQCPLPHSPLVTVLILLVIIIVASVMLNIIFIPIAPPQSTNSTRSSSSNLRHRLAYRHGCQQVLAPNCDYLVSAFEWKVCESPLRQGRAAVVLAPPEIRAGRKKERDRQTRERERERERARVIERTLIQIIQTQRCSCPFLRLRRDLRLCRRRDSSPAACGRQRRLAKCMMPGHELIFLVMFDISCSA